MALPVGTPCRTKPIWRSALFKMHTGLGATPSFLVSRPVRHCPPGSRGGGGGGNSAPPRSAGKGGVPLTRSVGEGRGSPTPLAVESCVVPPRAGALGGGEGSHSVDQSLGREEGVRHSVAVSCGEGGRVILTRSTGRTTVKVGRGRPAGRVLSPAAVTLGGLSWHSAIHGAVLVSGPVCGTGPAAPLPPANPPAAADSADTIQSEVTCRAGRVTAVGGGGGGVGDSVDPGLTAGIS